jgi:hypothetical protein
MGHSDGPGEPGQADGYDTMLDHDELDDPYDDDEYDFDQEQFDDDYLVDSGGREPDVR